MGNCNFERLFIECSSHIGFVSRVHAVIMHFGNRWCIFFGSLHHYDQSGKKTGESRLGLFGGINHYDEKGKKNGHSDPSIFGGWNDYEK